MIQRMKRSSNNRKTGGVLPGGRRRAIFKIRGIAPQLKTAFPVLRETVALVWPGI